MSVMSEQSSGPIGEIEGAAILGISSATQDQRKPAAKETFQRQWRDTGKSKTMSTVAGSTEGCGKVGIKLMGNGKWFRDGVYLQEKLFLLFYLLPCLLCYVAAGWKEVSVGESGWL
ncbi:hypothetical protein Dimus_002793 [Dionaea muscipula]